MYRRLRAYTRRLQYSTRIEKGLCGLASIDFKTVLDIGAADGGSAKTYLRLFPSAIVHSFEPQLQEWRKLLQLEIQEQRLHVYNTALGHSNKETLSLTRYKNQSTSTASLLSPTKLLGDPDVEPKIIETVTVATLDRWAERLGERLEEPILVKMDVQGYESHVIYGGHDVLSRTKAVIVEVCFEQYYEGQPDFWEIHFGLGQADLGFKYIGNLDQVAAPSGRIKYIDACFVRQ